MPTTHTIQTFTFEELDPKAKDLARDWFRKCGASDDWYESTYEDATRVADILGIEIGVIEQKWVNSANGKTGTHTKPRIWFSGFWSQGDGACFEGRYAYAKEAPKKIRSYAPNDTTLHSIADDLKALQRKHFYRLEATVKHSGHYYHSNCTEIDVTDSRTGDNVGYELEKELSVELRRFMNWIYQQLESESEYLDSNEYIDDCITANEYQFLADGRHASAAGLD